MSTGDLHYLFPVNLYPAYGSFIEALSNVVLNHFRNTPEQFLGTPLANALMVALDYPRWFGGEPLKYYYILWSPHWLLVDDLRCFQSVVKLVLEAIGDTKMSLNLDPCQLLMAINDQQPYSAFTAQEVTVAVRSWIAACWGHNTNLDRGNDILVAIVLHLLRGSGVQSPLYLLSMAWPAYEEYCQSGRFPRSDSIYALQSLIIDLLLHNGDQPDWSNATASWYHLECESTNLVNEAFTLLMDFMAEDFHFDRDGTCGFMYLSWLSVLPNSDSLAVQVLNRFGMKWFGDTPQDLKIGSW
jgi:hypothetical protein